MHRITIPVTIICLFLIISCTAPEPEITQTDMDHAREALKPFKSELMGALSAAMSEGAETAIRVCSEKAPEIAARLSTADISMGRTSHRLRNRENSPEAWMEPLLREYAADPSIKEPKAVILEDGRFGYVEPIHVKELCLNCHGGDLDEDISRELQAVYPDDKAIGFEEGDFRGMFWVTMKLQ